MVEIVRLSIESVWQPRFPQLVFSVEARKLSCFNKNENAKGIWKSIFAYFHTDSIDCARSFENDTHMALLDQLKANQLSCISSGCHDTIHNVASLDKVKMWSPQE